MCSQLKAVDIAAQFEPPRPGYHFFADDSLLSLLFNPTDNVSHTEAPRHVGSCLNDIIALMYDNMLKLNTDKTEVIVFTSHRNINFVVNVSVTVGE